MYTHNFEKKAGKVRAVLTYTGIHPFVESFDLGFFDSQELAIQALEKAEVFHAEDLTDPHDRPKNRLERFIDGTYHG